MMRAYQAMATLIFSIAFTHHGRSADIDPVWIERAKSEGRASCEKYVLLIGQIEEKYESRKEYDTPSNDPRYKPLTFRYRTAALDGHRLNERLIVSENGVISTAQLDCANGNYQFQLRKSGSAKDYVLTKYMPIKPGDTIYVSGAFSTVAFNDLSRLLNAIDGKGENTLKSLRWDDKRRLLYSHVAYNASPPPSVITVDVETWLDPTNHWRIVESHYKSPSNQSRSTITYGPPVDGLTLPSELVDTVSSQGNNTEPPYRIRSTMTVRKTALSPADFRLSAFGLPEPVDAPPVPRSPNYLWLFLAAAACAGLAVGFRRLARRHRVRHAV